MSGASSFARSADLPLFRHLRAELERRILVLDGAMGTMIQRHKPTEADYRGERFKSHGRDLHGNNDLFVLTRPEMIAEIHDQYLAAGSDIIETNTFSANAIAQADYELEPIVYELNVAAARLARRACDEWTAKTPGKPRFVAGAIGPTNRTLSMSPDVNDASFRAVTFDQMRVAYAEQVRGLIDGGVDLLIPETIVRHAQHQGVPGRDRGGLRGEAGSRLPVMLSVTIIDNSGRTLSGQTIDAFWTSVAHARPLSVGINCALGATQMRPYLAELASVADCYVSCYPNAGLPNAFGGYDEDAGHHRGAPARVRRQRPGEHRRRLLRHDAGAHRRDREDGRGTDAAPPAAATRVEAGLPRALRGLETLTICARGRNFLMIGERTNVTGSAKFAELITQGRLRQGAGGRARPGARRRQHPRRQHGRGDARRRGRDDDVPEPDRHRAGDRAHPDHGRQLEVVGDRGRPQVRAGQGDRQLDQPQGGARGFPAQGAPGPALRRRRRRHGVRRDRPGRHGRAQGRDLPARLQAAHRGDRLQPARHHLRSQHPGDRDRARGAQRVRARTSSRRRASSRRPARA